jgi:hypothetical protein
MCRAASGTLPGELVALVALFGGGVVGSENVGGGNQGGRLVDGRKDLGHGLPMPRLRYRSRSGGALEDYSRIVYILLISPCCC